MPTGFQVACSKGGQCLKSGLEEEGGELLEASASRDVVGIHFPAPSPSLFRQGALGRDRTGCGSLSHSLIAHFNFKKRLSREGLSGRLSFIGVKHITLCFMTLTTSS